MGLDLFDLTYRIEKELGVEISCDDLQTLTRQNDIVVGDLYALILKRLGLENDARYSLAVNRRVWQEVQASLAQVIGRPPTDIRLETPLDILFPPSARRTLWMQFRSQSPFEFPDLDYPRWVMAAGWGLAITAVGMEQLQLWQLRPAGWFWPLLGVLGLWTVWETHRKLLSGLARFRTVFPSRLRTVKDLCRAILAANLRHAALEAGGMPPVCESSIHIWEQLQDILSLVLGVERTQITFRSRLIRDLGAC